MGWEVGLLFAHSEILGNEVSENRNGILSEMIVKDSRLMGKRQTSIKLALQQTAVQLCIGFQLKDLKEKILV